MPKENNMVTKTTKKVVKKATKVVKKSNNVTMTVKQAQALSAFASRNGKTFKFLDTKINTVLNA